MMDSALHISSHFVPKALLNMPQSYKILIKHIEQFFFFLFFVFWWEGGFVICFLDKFRLLRAEFTEEGFLWIEKIMRIMWRIIQGEEEDCVENDFLLNKGNKPIFCL